MLSVGTMGWEVWEEFYLEYFFSMVEECGAFRKQVFNLVG